MSSLRRQMPVGTTVRLRLGSQGRPGPRRKATIVREYQDIPDGVVLEPTLEGFQSWNRGELEPCPSIS